MSRYFTHYWSNDTWDEEYAKWGDGHLLPGIYSNQFSRGKIQPGDSLYVMRVYEGDLYLLCRLTVKQVKPGESDDPRWRDRLDVNPTGRSPMRFNHMLARERAFSLRFIPSAGGSDQLMRTVSGGVGRVLSCRELQNLEDGDTDRVQISAYSRASSVMASHPRRPNHASVIAKVSLDDAQRAANDG